VVCRVLAVSLSSGEADRDLLVAGAVADGTATGGLLLGLASAAEVVAGVGTGTNGIDAGPGAAAGVVVRLGVVGGGAAFLVGDGLAFGVADGVGDGLAVGVAEGDGEALGVVEGSGAGVAVGVADGEAAAEEADGDGLGTGVALACTMSATVVAVTAWPGCTLAYAPAVVAGKLAELANPAPDEQAIAAAAPAVMAPRTARTVRFALRG
jgi:hypothetical protein